jgi:cell division protein FtsA
MSEQQLQYFVGLDIGTSAVRCVVGELSSDSNIPTIIAFSRAENTGMRKGNVAHIEEVAQAVIQAIQEAERVSGREIKYATVNVNGSHVQGLNSKGVVAISSPDRQISAEDRLRVEEAATVVQLPPNKEIIQVFAKNYRLDGQENIKDPVGMHGVRLEVDTHIVVASTPALKSLEQALERAEIRASHRTVTSLAAAEAMLDRRLKESGVAVLDIGAATTNLVVIEDGEVEHIAVIPMGGTHITNDLAIGLKTELEIAELVKLKHANLSKSVIGETSFVVNKQEFHFDRDMMRLIVEARVDEILEYADKELKRIHRSRKLPGGIVLTGGSAQLPGLAEFTRETMELPARVGSFKQIKRVVDNFSEPEFAPAVGLMLLDMYLGPAADISYLDTSGGMVASVNSGLNTILGRFKKKR